MLRIASRRFFLTLFAWLSINHLTTRSKRNKTLHKRAAHLVYSDSMWFWTFWHCNNQLKTLVQAFVSYRLDYCNSLLYCIDSNSQHSTRSGVIVRRQPADHVSAVCRSTCHTHTSAYRPKARIQWFTYSSFRVLTAVTRCSASLTISSGMTCSGRTKRCLVTETRRREHITPVWMQLHWLPVWHCIEFKLTFWSARRWIFEWPVLEEPGGFGQLTTATGRRRLGSSNVATCQVPRTHTSPGLRAIDHLPLLDRVSGLNNLGYLSIYDSEV